MKNAFVKVKFKYKGKNDEVIRDIIDNIFTPYFGGLNGRLDLITVKDKVVTLGVFQDYTGKFENVKEFLGKKVKGQVEFPLLVDDNYVPDTLEVVEVTE
ncbi:MAG: hypothetical protein CO114_08300 [Euryarchaeota archaeon CG_4_9_14_3_um_filter_38_12]|nr:MAG: hypothetical protein CO114_08300 [Euryarchaeota archaeon CG_4_9_14_3_um_filter_38_12]